MEVRFNQVKAYLLTCLMEPHLVTPIPDLFIPKSVNSGVLAENVDAASFLGGSPTTITVPASSSYAAFRSSSQAHSSGNVYSFYAAGTAPSFFAGPIVQSSLVGPDDINNVRIEGGMINATKYSNNNSQYCARFTRARNDANALGTERFIDFRDGDGNAVAQIRMDGAGTAKFIEGSDYRVKENIVDLPSAVDQVKALRPVNFNYKWAPEKTRPGFVAHELSQTLPVAVVGEKDEVETIGTYTDADGNVETEVTEPAVIPAGATWVQTETRDVYQGVDQTKLIPILTKALQEALERIEVLEAEHAQMMNNGGY